ncbi:ABC transporter ATP-binding protein [Syntrophobacter fumaroxidans]|uniref:ABC transporter related n=1 Tax=Syntrophobacter fumaroxidans (strain DSM 10017 / MPOB) TaxID=335543 RepID=A0LP73_SYNFM|nr:ABC transporter ATP-binding protein [Syntrophobacter fumaroxidans]ABK19225.1 ABC transporter related [Syntrophobacter fumaroxidans MPOB]
MRRKILPYLWPYRYPFLFALAQVFLMSGCELLKPWPLKIVIDSVLGDSPSPWNLHELFSKQALLVAACAGLIVIYLVLGGITLLNNYTTIKIGQRMVNDLRRDLYSHLQRLSLAFHSRRQVGDLMYRVTADTYAIQSLTMNGVFPIATALALLIGMFAVMLKIDWQLTVLALSVCPVLFLSISLLSKRISLAATVARQQESEVYSVVQRGMSAMRIIQAFTKEEEEHRKFMAASNQSLDASLRLYTLQTFYSGIINVVMALGTAFVVWVGAQHVLSGSLTVGEIVIFTAYLASLYAPINTISQTWGLIQGAKVGVQRVFEILDVERDLAEGNLVFPASGARGDVWWENVSFQYVPDQPVLKNVSLHVPAGRKVAIVGPTGVGKSTLLSLLPRFYDPLEGRVTLDGTDIRDFQLKSLRTQIAMVLQPPLVFPITVRENIAYGRPEATLEEVVEAAKLARIHDSIARLPQGYDTLVGEQGATLSEGERQRITIARAILRDAPVLILDEPTSSVDAETEALIMEGLNRLTANRTTFIIAHRLSTVRNADLIIVLRSGEIVEQGTFEELVHGNGPFALLYRSQFSLEE